MGTCACVCVWVGGIRDDFERMGLKKTYLYKEKQLENRELNIHSVLTSMMTLLDPSS